MRNAIRITGTLFWFVLVLAGSGLAQSQLLTKPAPAVSGPAYDLSVGYSHLRMAIASSSHANLDGVDATASVALSPRWGATVDSSYLRAARVPGTTHQAYMLGLHGGPVFYALDRGNTRVFLRALAGAALVDGAVPITSTSYFHGWLIRPSFAFGGGVEYPVFEQTAVRVNGDYLRTSFYDAAGAVQGQNNLRLTVSFVFRLRERQHR